MPEPDPTPVIEWPSPDEPPIPLEAGEFLNLAWERANRSLDNAKRLREEGFHGPSFVWAVRAAEIFTREFLLMPLFLDEENGVAKALRRASKVFGPGNWAKAYARLEEYVGPIDKMLTDTDEDAWTHWKRHASEIRGHVVHGQAEVTAELADWAIAYVGQLFKQMVLRMIVSGKHPASDVFMNVVEAARQTLKDDSAGESFSPAKD